MPQKRHHKSRCTDCRAWMDHIEAQQFEECRQCRKKGRAHRIARLTTASQSHEDYTPQSIIADRVTFSLEEMILS